MRKLQLAVLTKVFCLSYAPLPSISSADGRGRVSRLNLAQQLAWEAQYSNARATSLPCFVLETNGSRCLDGLTCEITGN
jgi:hypothetical protein